MATIADQCKQRRARVM